MTPAILDEDRRTSDPNRGVVCARGCSDRPCDHVAYLVAAIRAEERVRDRSPPAIALRKVCVSVSMCMRQGSIGSPLQQICDACGGVDKFVPVRRRLAKGLNERTELGSTLDQGES